MQSPMVHFFTLFRPRAKLATADCLNCTRRKYHLRWMSTVFNAELARHAGGYCRLSQVRSIPAETQICEQLVQLNCSCGQVCTRATECRGGDFDLSGHRHQPARCSMHQPSTPPPHGLAASASPKQLAPFNRITNQPRNAQVLNI